MIKLYDAKIIEKNAVFETEQHSAVQFDQRTTPATGSKKSKIPHHLPYAKTWTWIR